MQSSDAADRFGVTGYRPEELTYWFGEENLEGVKKELEEIERGKYGKYLSKLDVVFEKASSYNDEMIMKALNLTDEKEAVPILREYYDYKLGLEIKECIEECGSCGFTAEI